MTTIKIITSDSGTQPSAQQSQSQSLNRIATRNKTSNTALEEINSFRSQVNTQKPSFLRQAAEQTTIGRLGISTSDTIKEDPKPGGISAGAQAGLAAVAVAAYAVNTYIDNTGWRTNDQTAQNKVNNVKKTGGRLASIGAAAGGGFAVGGPIGAAIGAATAVAIQAIQLSSENAKIIRRIADSQKQSAFDSERLGLIYSSKGRG
jgi:hypothetical protein